MIKKHLLTMAALATGMGVAHADYAASSPTTSSTPATTYTSSASAMAARSAFIQGWFIGLNPGWQQNKVKGSDNASLDFNSPALGAHIDYNHLISNPVFIGAGLDVNYSFKKKKLAEGVTIKKDLSGALTARLGVVSGPVAFNINVAFVVSGFKIKYPGGSENQTRNGFAPGVGITFCVAKNLTAGINYRYEIYPKKGDNKPRINSHNIFAKLSYNLSK